MLGRLDFALAGINRRLFVSQVGERAPLLSALVEVGRVQPGLEAGAQGRPVPVEDGEPGGVAGPALDDQVLAEDPLEMNSQTCIKDCLFN